LNSQLGKLPYDQLGKVYLRKQRQEAEQYAATPARFTIICMEVVIQTEDGAQLISGADGDWACSCPFYTIWNPCSHIMALDIIGSHNMGALKQVELLVRDNSRRWHFSSLKRECLPT